MKEPVRIEYLGIDDNVEFRHARYTKAVWRVRMNSAYPGDIQDCFTACINLHLEMTDWCKLVAGTENEDWWVTTPTHSIISLNYFFNPSVSVAFKLRFG